MEVKVIIEKLRELDQKLSQTAEYQLGKHNIAFDIAMHREQIFKELEENPDTFLALKSEYFKDLSFIADALEVAYSAEKKIIEKWFNQTFKDLSNDKKKSEHPENYAKINKKDMTKGSNDTFAYLVKLKIKKELKTLKKQKEDLENSREFQAEHRNANRK